MEISVVIPTHDRAALLTRALDSVYAQTRPAEEVIVVDDGSSDGTRELLAARYPQATVIGQPVSGVSRARNRGINAATCDWIALLDSDDCWHPDKLAAQAAALEAGPGHRLCHSNELWVRRGVRVNPMRKHAKGGGWIYRDCLPRCVISPSSALLQRSLLESVGGFDEALPACEDYDLWLRICARHPVLYLETPLITKYGGHADQLSRRYWGMDRFRVHALEKILESNVLDDDDRAATQDTLLTKLQVLVQGARRRGNRQVRDVYQSKLDHWRDILPGAGHPPHGRSAAC